jgi:hypothetical protein
MTEEFRDIPGYEGLYQVSNLGTVIFTQNNKTITETSEIYGGLNFYEQQETY